MYYIVILRIFNLICLRVKNIFSKPSSKSICSNKTPSRTLKIKLSTGGNNRAFTVDFSLHVLNGEGFGYMRLKQRIISLDYRLYRRGCPLDFDKYYNSFQVELTSRRLMLWKKEVRHLSVKSLKMAE